MAKRTTKPRRKAKVKTFSVEDFHEEREELKGYIQKVSQQAAELEQALAERRQLIVANRGALIHVNEMIFKLDPDDEEAYATHEQGLDASEDEEEEVDEDDEEEEEEEDDDEEEAPVKKVPAKKKRVPRKLKAEDLDVVEADAEEVAEEDL
jgi:hypothetical protein